MDPIIADYHAAIVELRLAGANVLADLLEIELKRLSEERGL